MDAVKYLEARGRMCSTITNCNKCPMNAANNGTNADCADFQRNYPKKAVDVMEKWLIIHPVKSYLDVYKEAMAGVGVTYPNNHYVFGHICINDVFHTSAKCCSFSFDCAKHWHSECKLPINGE